MVAKGAEEEGLIIIIISSSSIVAEAMAADTLEAGEAMQQEMGISRQIPRRSITVTVDLGK